MEFRKLTTKEKALQINLDLSIYGSFAEIGAGQETAANFFKAGAASGTIAKTMSAYDMKFSDIIYGKSKRYVSEHRLMMMLEHEFQLLLERLPHRVSSTRFFVFANTVQTLNYHKTNDGDGWIGFRFQLKPNSAFNECVIHVLLKDNDSNLQQQTLGILGVNLIYACMHISDPEELMQSLTDNISKGRIEVDFFRINGADFQHVDNRLMALKLVKFGLSSATMFDSDGKVLQPADALHKKSILLLRGRFRPVTYVNLDMLQAALEAMNEKENINNDRVTMVSELTLNDLSGEEGISDKDFLNRADTLASLGLKVMISDYQKYFKLIEYLIQLTHENIRIVLGFGNLQKLFDETYYTDLTGGILESFGRLFKNNVKIYVYPYLGDNKVALLKSGDMKLSDKVYRLYQYLYQNHQIEDLVPLNIEHLKIKSDQILEMIRQGDAGWEDMVPKPVLESILTKGLFDYKALQT
jgi:hypothetical protein